MDNDILMDKLNDKDPWNVPVSIHTHRSGIFKFQAGIDISHLESMINRVNDAHHSFSTLPILPDWANMLEKEIVVSSVFGTNTIEGGTLSEEETAAVLESPESAKGEKEKRVTNIKNAYNLAEDFAQHTINKYGKKGRSVYLAIIEEMFIDLHKHITKGLTHPNNVPGQYRNNPKDLPTKVSDPDHGGIYRPPKCLDDIKMLMDAFIKWANSEPIIALSPLIRAPLVHYYFERIHPFWDGNGRVGRVVEAMILKAAGYKYAPFALSKYYLENIDEHFTVFNIARKAEDKKEKYPNKIFVDFFLNGMLEVINKQHDRIRRLIALLVHDSQIHDLLNRKVINKRQYIILKHLQTIREIKLSGLQTESWYELLYDNLTHKTRDRDLKNLYKNKLVFIDKKKLLRIVFPGIE
jgi:Fic family protein